MTLSTYSSYTSNYCIGSAPIQRTTANLLTKFTTLDKGIYSETCL